MQILSIIVISIAGVVLINANIADILMLNRALSVQFFLYFGYLIKKHKAIMDHVKPWQMIIGAAMYIGIGITSIVCFPGMNLDVHRGFYYNLPICFAMILIGCFVLFSGAERMKARNIILSHIGRNTLICYIWASYPSYVYVVLMSRLHISISNSYLEAGFKTAFVFANCCLVSIIINKFLPEMVGKKRIKPQQ